MYFCNFKYLPVITKVSKYALKNLHLFYTHANAAFVLCAKKTSINTPHLQVKSQYSIIVCFSFNIIFISQETREEVDFYTIPQNTK